MYLFIAFLSISCLVYINRLDISEKMLLLFTESSTWLFFFNPCNDNKKKIIFDILTVMNILHVVLDDFSMISPFSESPLSCWAYLKSFAPYHYFYTFVYHTVLLPWWVEFSPMARKTKGSIRGWVIRKTQKMVLDVSLLNSQHYKIRIKGKVKQSKVRSSTVFDTSV